MTFSELVDLVYEAAERGSDYLVEAEEKGKTRGKLSPDEWASMTRGARASAAMPKRVKQQAPSVAKHMTPEELAAHTKKAEEFAPLTPEERIAARQSEADYMSSVEDLSPQEEKNLKELKQRNARRQAFLEREREKARAEIEQGTVGGEKRKEESEYERTRYQELRDKEERNALGRERKYGPVNLRSNKPGEVEERPFDIKQWEKEVAKKRAQGEEGIVLPSTLESGKKPFAPDPKGLTAAPNLPSISHIKKEESIHWSDNPNAAPGFIKTDKGVTQLKKQGNKDQKRRLNNIFKSAISMGAGPKLDAAMKPYIETYNGLYGAVQTYNSAVYNIDRLLTFESQTEDDLEKAQEEHVGLKGVIPKLFERLLKIEKSIKSHQEEKHRLIGMIQTVAGSSSSETRRLRASAKAELDDCDRVLETLEKQRRELQNELNIHETEVSVKGGAMSKDKIIEAERQHQIRAQYEQLQAQKQKIKNKEDKALDALMHATAENESEIRDRLDTYDVELKAIQSEIDQNLKLFSGFKSVEMGALKPFGAKQLAETQEKRVAGLVRKLTTIQCGKPADEKEGKPPTKGIYGFGGDGNEDNIHPKSYTGLRDQAVKDIVRISSDLDERRDGTFSQILDTIMPLGIDVRAAAEREKSIKKNEEGEYDSDEQDATTLGTIQRWYDYILNDVRQSYAENILGKQGESEEFISPRYHTIDPIASLYRFFINAKLNVERALKRKPLSWGDYGLKDIMKYIFAHSPTLDKATGKTIPALPSIIDSSLHTTNKGLNTLIAIRGYFDRLVSELKDTNAQAKVRELFDQFTMSTEARMYNAFKPTTAKPMDKNHLAGKIQALVKDAPASDEDAGELIEIGDELDFASEEDEVMEATANGSVVVPTAEQNQDSEDLDELEAEIKPEGESEESEEEEESEESEEESGEDSEEDEEV